jgi:hypothetical protein
MSAQLAPLAGDGDGFGQGAQGLVDEAGEQVDDGVFVAEPGAAALGEGGQRVIEDGEGVLAGAWRDGGLAHAPGSCSLAAAGRRPPARARVARSR